MINYLLSKDINKKLIAINVLLVILFFLTIGLIAAYHNSFQGLFASTIAFLPFGLISLFIFISFNKKFKQELIDKSI
jgi:F0F1-type ATP synthase assembly protein I